METYLLLHNVDPAVRGPTVAPDISTRTIVRVEKKKIQKD